MNLGVFGDSFADLGPIELIDDSIGRRPWPITLAGLMNAELGAYGLTATSTWYSYKTFLREHSKMDTVVFCYSSNDRWHTINTHNGTAPIHHVISPAQLPFTIPEFRDLAKKLLEVHPNIFDPELNLFVVQNVFNSINDICREKNIKLVNILTFEEYNGTPLSIDISKNSGTVLTNLGDVSGAEIRKSDGSPKDKTIHRQITQFYDKRFCHISPYNNTVLANIIKDCMDNDIPYINLRNDDRFSYDIEHNRYIVE